MDAREKLVELLGADTCKHDCCEDCEYCEDRDACIDYLKNSMADHLIANGVTVQEWISVKDRLPEEWHTVIVFVPSIDAIIPAKLRGGFWYSTWDTTRLDNVSYWMPMPEKPQPPKGE